MSHNHWPQDLIERVFLPPYPVPATCPFKTVKACNENYTTFTHGHLGTPCVKDYQIAKSTTRRADGTVVTQKGQPNKIATCTLAREV